MKKEILVLSTMACVIFIVTIISSTIVLFGISKQNAMLNEYEYVLADVWAEKEDCWAEKENCWAEKEDCKEQLGIFYKE